MNILKIKNIVIIENCPNINGNVQIDVCLKCRFFRRVYHENLECSFRANRSKKMQKLMDKQDILAKESQYKTRNLRTNFKLLPSTEQMDVYMKMRPKNDIICTYAISLRLRSIYFKELALFEDFAGWVKKNAKKIILENIEISRMIHSLKIKDNTEIFII